jgi:hypothetical protein
LTGVSVFSTGPETIVGAASSRRDDEPETEVYIPDAGVSTTSSNIAGSRFR